MPATLKTENTKRNRLTNYMEELAENILQDMLSKNGKNGRFSKDAIQDIKALALNRLWPMYTTSTSGKEFLKKIIVEDKVEQDIVRELRAAMDKVRLHPRD